MGRYIVKRLLWMIPVILGVSILIFTLLYFVPGDPASIILGTNASAEAKIQMRHELGLDQPFMVQLGAFLRDTFLRFDFGSSYVSKQPVLKEILTRLPYTLKVCWIGLAIALVLGVPLGVVAATNKNTWKDNLSMFVSILFISMPNFWFALSLISLFAIQLGWLPVQGVNSMAGYIIPIICTTIGTMAQFTRMTRSSMLEVLHQDYITTAKAKGQTGRNIIWRHAFRNAMLPIVTALGGLMAGSIGFGVVVEQIFSIPGIGAYLLIGINMRDYPVIRGCVLMFAIIFSLMSLITDLVYGVVDPRMKTVIAKKKKKKPQKAIVTKEGEKHE